MPSEERVRVGVLFGGESAEHEVSLQSALNVMEAIDEERYEVVPIGIDRRGRWHLVEPERFLLDAADPRRIRLGDGGRDVTLLPGESAEKLVALDRAPDAGPPVAAGRGVGEPDDVPPLDVVFPVLHGPLGEDGTVQGLLRLAHIPFVGAGVLGSAIGMDKDVSKRLLRDAGIPVAAFRVLRRSGHVPGWEEVAEALGSPVFVKPSALGSSVGVHRVADAEAYRAAVADAFEYDVKVLLEERVAGRELECSVLGNEEPIASLPGEIVAREGFYSYEAKYLDEHGAELLVPADLPEETVRSVQELSIATFRTLCCEGMARVDFFLREDGRLVVNELNSIPGFTRISMYPKLWEASGIGYTELIDRLIRLALERHERDRRLRTTVSALAEPGEAVAAGDLPPRER